MKLILSKILFAFVCFFGIPFFTDAATVSFENEQKSDNKVTFDIVYKPGETPVDAVNLNIIPSNNEEILYEIKSFGTGNNCKDLDSCFLVTYSLNDKESSVIATLTLTNIKNEGQETVLAYNAQSNGTLLNSDNITVSLKPFVQTTTVATTTTTTTTRIKNSDSNLSNLKVSIGTLDQSFDKNITNYVVTGIKDTVSSITLTSTCDNYCSMNVICPSGECSVSNMKKNDTADGKNELVAKINMQTGANQVFVISTSETGINKTYTMNIYRGEVEVNSSFLSSITINNAKLNEKFDPELIEYTVTVGKDVTELDISPVTEDPEATVVIKGNKNFKEANQKWEVKNIVSRFDLIVEGVLHD